MASAVLASQNEGYWGERNVYMKKYNSTTPPLATQLNPNHIINPILTPIPNPKPNSSFRQIHEASPKPHVRHTNDPSTRPVTPPASSDKQQPAYAYKPISVHGEYMMYNLNMFSRREKKELKKRLFSDLDRVRSLLNQIESRDHGVRPSIPFWPTMVQPNSLAVEALSQKQTMKVTGKNSGKKNLGKKRGAGAHSFPYDRKPKRPSVVSNLSVNKVHSSMMKRCRQILTKLMKHRHGWVFNTPVDVKGLGLHDYYLIIKSPMDLGTVKFRMEKNVYESPMDFAADVRQTFNNAMIYNPKGQDVHIMAVTLLNLFEEMFNQACKKYEAEQRKISVAAAEQLNHQKKFPELEHLSLHRRSDESILMAKTSDIMRPQLKLQIPSQVQNVKSPVSVPPPLQPIARSGKLPKPKAKDPYKRDMTSEEKQKLGALLQELPSEKLGQMIEIVKRRTSNLLQEGDEIEVDIEILDNETLWELDRFVGYHKKAVSKFQRQMLFQEATPAEQILAQHSPRDEPVEIEGQQMKKDDVVGEEDVDIGEEIPVNNFPPVEIERDAVGAGNESSGSSSSSSGSDSSSSSDSDSESSTGSDSDEDSVQSPFVVDKDNPC
ncbi:transcription factor GTE2-like [Olea europaea subsp. europaea]|uniref:Transcription factor GTE2-like n=1 Tax=Olea europaea subsp. europaea TaxID=158383 RepID=A0A8S0U885_OLEEU|nr:transcription factor GTE2-like [Olea europaea subsp. europaea]